jgi:hypothetical protein
MKFVAKKRRPAFICRIALNQTKMPRVMTPDNLQIAPVLTQLLI